MKRTLHRSSTIQRGSSLLLVLWAIMLMSFSVMGLVSHLSNSLDDSIREEKEFRARLLLQSAVVLSKHPAIEPGDPLLRQEVSPVAAYEVSISTEGAHLAINQLGTNPAQRLFAKRLFEKWGLDSRQSQSLSDAIADWIDPNDRPLAQGAEREYYAPLGRPDFPFNKPFENIDDLMQVRGFSDLDRLRPDWRNYFTLYGDGTIDVHTAPAEILAALFDVNQSEIGRFISTRLGPDQQRETIDDPRFASLPEVRKLLDVPQANYLAVSSLLTLNHPIKRTECRARAGNLERSLTLITGPGITLLRED